MLKISVTIKKKNALQRRIGFQRGKYYDEQSEKGPIFFARWFVGVLARGATINFEGYSPRFELELVNRLLIKVPKITVSSG